MELKYKIITGFPCNNGSAYMIILENHEPLITKNKEAYDKAMKEGYITVKVKGSATDDLNSHVTQ